MSNLQKDIEEAINRASAENESNTPDWILAQYLIDCLATFDKAVNARDSFYGERQKILASSPKEEICIPSEQENTHSHPACVFNYCPHPDACKEPASNGCINKRYLTAGEQ